MSKQIMQWDRLISDQRFGLESHSQKQENRTDFQRDYDRLVFSSPFRRLQNKTQVFPLPGRIFVHNRLTHSLEVSCIGRSLGTQIGRKVCKNTPSIQADHSDFGAIVSAACLAHDMGNPPFGHAGERAISAYFTEGKGTRWESIVRDEGGRWEDFSHFEGNANALRLLTNGFKGRRKGGFVLTYSTIASIVKYPYSSIDASEDKPKFGFFSTEQSSYERIAQHLGILRFSSDSEPPIFARHPLVYLVEAADDICYQIMDLEDAYKLKIISLEECKNLLLALIPESQYDSINRVLQKVTDKNEQVAYLRSIAIGTLVNCVTRAFMDNEKEILEGSFQGSLIQSITEREREAYAQIRHYAFEHIYFTKEVLDIEFAGYRIFEYLLDILIEAQLHPNKSYSKLWFNRIPEQYDMHRQTLYGKIQSALDYISSMTDIYALDIYRKFTGMSLPAV